MTDNKDLKKLGATVNIVEEDLLFAKDDVIVHQCNCVTNKPLGLAKDIFRRFPHADIYTDRKEPSEPGTIVVRGNTALRRVVGLLAQRYPGPSKFHNDKVAMRMAWFRSCLDLLAELNYKKIGFPNNIGCGLAGGSWEQYLDLIKKWAERLPSDVVINIYKL